MLLPTAILRLWGASLQGEVQECQARAQLRALHPHRLPGAWG